MDVTDKAVSDKAVSDKAVSDKAVSDKAVSDKAVDWFCSYTLRWFDPYVISFVNGSSILKQGHVKIEWVKGRKKRNR